MELREKLADVDKSLAGLTHIVADFIRTTGYPVTEQAIALMENIEMACGTGAKRISSFDDPPSQYRRTMVVTPDTPEDLMYDTNQPDREDHGEDTDDSASVTAMFPSCDDDKEGISSHASEADFDDFLSFIADENHEVHVLFTGDPACSPYTSTSTKSSIPSGFELDLPPRLKASKDHNNCVLRSVSVRDIPCVLTPLSFKSECKSIE